jgi:hypothetical protein
MQESVLKPASAFDQPEVCLERQPRIVHHFREIVLWPLQIVPLGGETPSDGCVHLFEKAAAGTPWRRFDIFGSIGGDESELKERHYREFISFLPHAQRLLYGEAPAPSKPAMPGDIPMKIYRREDIKAVRITPEKGAAPVLCDVVHLHLYFFYEINTAILSCELAAEEITLEAAQGVMQTFGRAYPAGWTKEGAPVHCAELVEWLDEAGDVLESSDHRDKSRFLSFVGGRRAPCIARHWEFVLAPIVNAAGGEQATLGFREIEYYRMPVMSFIALDSLDVLTKRDYIALALATRPAKNGIVPFSKRFLRKFEADHVYDRLYSGGLDAPEIETRFLTTGESFTIVSAGASPSLTDNERGLLGQFRHQYFLMFMIAHFHKASLLMIADQLVAALRRLDPDKPETANAFRDETLRLQESFLRFSQRYFFTELSGRAHIRDLFRMIRRHLNIDALFEEVRNELADLVQYLESAALRKQNTAMHRLTVVAVIGLVGTIVTGFLGMNLIAEADQPLVFKIEFFGAVTLVTTTLVALAVFYSRRLTDLLERLSEKKR